MNESFPSALVLRSSGFTDFFGAGTNQLDFVRELRDIRAFESDRFLVHVLPDSLT